MVTETRVDQVTGTEQDFIDRAGLVADIGIPSLRKNEFAQISTVATSAFSVADPTEVTIASAVYADQDGVIISGVNVSADANGAWLATRVSATAFTIPVNVATVTDAVGLAELIGNISYAQTDNVRAYRVLAKRTSGGAASDYVKAVEDSINNLSAASRLITALSGESVDYLRVEDGVWSEWQELSKNLDDLSLQDLHFAATDGLWDIMVEAR